LAASLLVPPSVGVDDAAAVGPSTEWTGIGCEHPDNAPSYTVGSSLTARSGWVLLTNDLLKNHTRVGAHIGGLVDTSVKVALD